MPEYRVVVHDLVHKGGAKIAEVEVKNLMYTKILNAPGSIGFILPIHHPKCTFEIFKPGARELRVYKDDELKWGGYLWTAFREGSEEGGELSGGQIHMRFGGEGWLSRLKKRRLRHDKSYVNQDVYDIAWDYINYTQQRTHGNLGITRFSTALREETQSLEWFAWQRRSILELIGEIAESDEGFDFEITPEKQWKTYQRQGNRVPKVVELGRDRKNNIKNYTYAIDAITSLTTELSVAGKGENAQKLFSVLSDPTSLLEYGLLEDVENKSEIDNQGILDAICSLLLRLYKEPREDITTYVSVVDPEQDEYQIGDDVTVRINDGYTQIDRDLRIKSIVTSVPNVGDASVGVFYDEVYV